MSFVDLENAFHNLDRNKLLVSLRNTPMKNRDRRTIANTYKDKIHASRWLQKSRTSIVANLFLLLSLIRKSNLSARWPVRGCDYYLILSDPIIKENQIEFALMVMFNSFYSRVALPQRGREVYLMMRGVKTN